MQTYRMKRSQMPDARQMGTPLSGGIRAGMPNSAMLSALGGDVSSGLPDLQALMQQRVAALHHSSGISRQLPDGLRGKMEHHFGVSLDGVEFRESSDVNAIDAQAYASGSVIHFRPGQFQPDSIQGQKMIGHEVSHLVQQSRGLAGGGHTLNLNPSLESAADLDGSAVASMSGDYAPSEGLPALQTASAESAPIQGWGVGGLLSFLLNHRFNKKSGYANKLEGGHEMLTRKASEKAEDALRSENLSDKADLLSSEKGTKSLKAGARFNDVYDNSNLSFGVKYSLESDEFLNQTHHGDMQFLHSMDASHGDQNKNIEKIRRWGKFAADTSKNENGFQDQNMLDYLMGRDSDPILQEMLLSTMISKEKLQEIEEQSKKITEGHPEEYDMTRLAGIRGHLQLMMANRAAANNKNLSRKDRKKAKKALKQGLSSYANKSIGEFFTGGNKDLDAGQVALGSAAHMLEDSFAGSHAIREYNVKYPDNIAGLDVGQGQENAIAGQTTPIMINANYDYQDPKKHSTADFLRIGTPSNDKSYDEDDANIAATQGAGLARDVAAQYIYMALSGEGDLDQFLTDVTQVSNTPNKMTGAGRQYGRTAKVPGAEKEIERYEKDMAENIAPNIHQTADQRNEINARHLGYLSNILAKIADEKSKEEYLKHVAEIQAETAGMIRQLEEQHGSQEQIAALKQTLETANSMTRSAADADTNANVQTRRRSNSIANVQTAQPQQALDVTNANVKTRRRSNSI